MRCNKAQPSSQVFSTMLRAPAATVQWRVLPCLHRVLAVAMLNAPQNACAAALKA